MGKATITGGGANGLYNISIKYDNARAKARLDAINSQLDTLSNTSIPDALAVKNAAKAQHDTALSYLNDYLDSVTPDQFDPSISGQLTVQAMQTKSVYDETNKAYKKLLLQETALQKEKTKLQNAPEDEPAQAWCADFTEDLTGDVGVIDVGYEDKDISIIKPHALEGAGYNAADDGIISSFFNHTAHQLYTNRAYLPAMAKWKPRYRTGSITSLDGDTCNVDLDPYVSSQQNLDINQSTSLTGVPIQYMSCNGAAFQVGDSVVVEFSGDWNAYRVIGFVSNPRICWPAYFNYFLDLSVGPDPSYTVGVYCSNPSTAVPEGFNFWFEDFQAENYVLPIPTGHVYSIMKAYSRSMTESIKLDNLVSIESSDYEIVEFNDFNNGYVYQRTAVGEDFNAVVAGDTANYSCSDVFINLLDNPYVLSSSFSARRNNSAIKYDLASGYSRIGVMSSLNDILSYLDKTRPSTVNMRSKSTGQTKQYIVDSITGGLDSCRIKYIPV